MKANELSVSQWIVSRWLLYQAGSSLMLEALWEFMWRTSQDCSAEGWEIWITSPPPWSFLGWGLPFRELNPQPSEVPLAGLASFSGRGTPKSERETWGAKGGNLSARRDCPSKLKLGCGGHRRALHSVCCYWQGKGDWECRGWEVISVLNRMLRMASLRRYYLYKYSKLMHFWRKAYQSEGIAGPRPWAGSVLEHLRNSQETRVTGVPWSRLGCQVLVVGSEIRGLQGPGLNRPWRVL